MINNRQTDDSSDDGGSERSDSSATNSMSSKNGVNKSISRNIASSVAISNEESFRTPAPAKKKIRRTNAQIQADTAAKDALKLVKY
jgi:hypothetical protein